MKSDYFTSDLSQYYKKSLKFSIEGIVINIPDDSAWGLFLIFVEWLPVAAEF